MGRSPLTIGSLDDEEVCCWKFMSALYTRANSLVLSKRKLLQVILSFSCSLWNNVCSTFGESVYSGNAMRISMSLDLEVGDCGRSF